MIVLLFVVACAESGTSIFPSVSTSLVEAEVNFPNPLSLSVDPSRNQLYLVNSNVDVLFETGSLAVLDFDATTTTSPTVTAKQILPLANFCGEAYFDGNNLLVIPFREEYEFDTSLDTIQSFIVGDDSATHQDTAAVAANPFGTVADSAGIYVVSDNYLTLMNTDLGTIRTQSLESVSETYSDSNARFVYDMAIDTTNNIGYVSNQGGRLFVLDLSEFTGAPVPVRQLIIQPESTRDIIVDSTARRLYVLDGVTESVWIYNIDQLPALSSTSVAEINITTALIGAVAVGNNPNGMALDSTNNRLYVANSLDDTVSVIDTVTQSQILTIELDEEALVDSGAFNGYLDEPRTVQLGTFNSTVYLFVLGYKTGNMAVVNTSTNTVVSVYPNVAP